MSKLFKNTPVMLFLIVLVAGFLRFYQLSSNPPSLTWDEASWGYNAYSLGIDGRDEFGRFLPIDYLESFGDFKPPMYAYLSIIPVKVFGLNEFSTRSVSAFFGTLTVLLTYFLTMVLFANHKKDNDSSQNGGETIALFSSLLLAISPWHILLSRAAFEANVATFFIILGLLAFILGVQKKTIFIIVSVIAFCLSVYTFNSARVVAPILVIVLSIGFYKKLFKIKKYVLLAGIIGFLMILPIFKFLTSTQASLRFKEVNIFSDIEIVKTANQEIKNDNNAVWSKIIHNRRVAYTREYLKHYFDNLSPEFLFIRGDRNPKFSIQDIGQMYLWELPFFIGGIFLLFRKRERYWWVVPVWLLLGIIPAGFARETPHALRIENSIPSFMLLTAYGISGFLHWLKNDRGIFGKNRKAIIFVAGILLFMNVIYFLNQYFTHYRIEQSREWQYGYKESMTYALENEKKYNQVFITDKLGRPYIYYLFYAQTPPEIFRKNASVSRDAFGFVTVKSIGKYEFTSSARGSNAINNLYVDIPSAVPESARILQRFKAPDGSDAVISYTL